MPENWKREKRVQPFYDIRGEAGKPTAAPMRRRLAGLPVLIHLA